MFKENKNRIRLKKFKGKRKKNIIRLKKENLVIDEVEIQLLMHLSLVRVHRKSQPLLHLPLSECHPLLFGGCTFQLKE